MERIRDFAAIDFETANGQRTSVCSVGVVVVRGGRPSESIYRLIRPYPNYYSAFTTAIHGLTRSDTENAPSFPDVWGEIAPRIEGLPLVAHNSPFDEGCLRAVHAHYGLPYPDYRFLCTLSASRRRIKGLPNYQLHTVSAACGYLLERHHHALADAEACAEIALLAPVFEHLRQVRAGLSEDTVRIVHIGDSHVRGHIYPQTTGTRLTETFGAVSYIDKGVNGATCLTFTHPDRIAEIAALKPELLILSFGTNESHNRRYNINVHYNQMDELVKLLHDSLPNVPILLTTPPGSYESFRQRRRRRTYAINPRTATAAETIRRYAKDHRLLVWDMYDVVGGKRRACTNWTDAKLMRPDHVHYLPEGYILQGNLLYQALIKAYNDYVSH